MFEITDLHKTYDGSDKEVKVLTGVDFQSGAGEFVGIFGASGSGKSTFLHTIGGLDRPDRGTVKFDGEDIYAKNWHEIARFRNRSIGFVFQFYHLLREFTALENVMLPCLIAGLGRGESRRRASTAISVVDLDSRENHRPSELSGGEQQRVAIARAIVMCPRYILADEPTGNLDIAAGEKVFSYLLKLNKESGTGIIMVTHNPDLLKRIPRRLELKGGVLR